jgi:hypothetical protein
MEDAWLESAVAGKRGVREAKEASALRLVGFSESGAPKNMGKMEMRMSAWKVETDVARQNFISLDHE